MKVFEGITIRPISWIRAASYACVLVLIYYSALKELYFQWSGEDYSYCWLIPFIVLYLVWEKRAALAAIPSRTSWAGLVPLCIGIFLFWLGELGGEYYTLYTSLWFVVIGLLYVHLGWEKIRSIGFALVFIFAMFPFPNLINFPLALKLRLISSQLGVRILQLNGMSAYREGNTIDLGFTQLQVIDACSGIRYLFPLMILALLLAYWFKGHMWKRVALFLSSIPMTIVINVFRIAATGMLYGNFGAAVAEGFFHSFSGWLTFMVAIPVFLLEIWILGKLPPRLISGTPYPALPDSAVSHLKIQLISRPFFHPAFITALILLMATAVMSRTIDFREKIPIKKPLAELPAQIGEWNGVKERMEQQFMEGLQFSDYVIADYRNPAGRSVNFYTAYYESQRKGEAIHSPEACLPGSGWVFNQTGLAEIPVGNGQTIRVNRAFMEKAGQKQLSYFWFAQRNRVLTNLYQVKVYTFWSALTKHRTDGALVRLITPIYGNEDAKEAEKRLQGFTQLMFPVLKSFIPE
jgi:exosortase D (VPLPA-CTERM-specific)